MCRDGLPHQFSNTECFLVGYINIWYKFKSSQYFYLFKQSSEYNQIIIFLKFDKEMKSKNEGSRAFWALVWDELLPIMDGIE